MAYYDLTFSPVKSGSVYWAGLLETGRDAEAANVVAAHRAAVAAAMAYVEEQVAYVRSGYHGKTASGQSVGVYEEARGLVWIRWDHSTSRAQQPQLHSHVTVLNRAETVSDGVIRALASRGFKPIKQAADAIYTKVFEERLVASNGVVFATREDGKAREIVGFSTQLLAKASSRNADVTTRREELIQQFEQAHGRAPSPVEHKQMDVAAWRETRQAKNYAVAPRQQVSNWAEPVREQLTAEVAAADAAGGRLARDGHPEQQGYETRDREQVLRAALRTVQRRYATWDVGNLAMAIRDEQVCTPAVAGSPPDLAAEVLARGRPVRGRGAVGPRRRHRAARAAPPGRAQPLPDAQRRGVRHHRSAGDRSGHRRARPRHRRYRAVRAGAGAGRGGAAGRRARSRTSATTVLQILSSGRCGDILIGPAGAGKSRTVGALARVWEQQIGGRVLGVATSNIAARVLVDDGLNAMNTRRFLHRYGPDEHGHVRERLRREDLVVVDEAGMSSTEDLDGISAIVAAAGAKLLYTGDHEQLTAVGAGGMLELLVRDAGAAELTEIHRFTHAWERAASVRLRVGDPDVVAVYDAHGRIRGGTEQEMIAVRGPRLPRRRPGRPPVAAGRAVRGDGQGAVGADPRRAGRRRAGLGRGARRDQRRQPRRRRRPDPGPPQRLHPAGPRRPPGHQPRDVRGDRPQPVDRHADRARPRRDPGAPARRLRQAAHDAGLRGHLLRRAGPDGRHQPQPGRPGHHPGRGVRAGQPRHATPTPST